MVGTRVVIAASSTTRPAWTLACRVGAPSGSTPMIRISGPERLGRDRDARDQAAAADRDDQHIEIGRIRQDLERDRALAGDHRRVGEGMDVGQAITLGAGERRPVALVPDPALDLEPGAPALDLLGLERRDVGRHEHGRGRAGDPAGVGDRGAVIAAGRGDDAAADLGLGERAELADRAPRLERARHLQAFELEHERGAVGKRAAHRRGTRAAACAGPGPRSGRPRRGRRRARSCRAWFSRHPAAGGA